MLECEESLVYTVVKMLVLRQLDERELSSTMGLFRSHAQLSDMS